MEQASSEKGELARRWGQGRHRGAGGLKLEKKNSRQLGQNTRQLPGVEPPSCPSREGGLRTSLTRGLGCSDF